MVQGATAVKDVPSDVEDALVGILSQVINDNDAVKLLRHRQLQDAIRIAEEADEKELKERKTEEEKKSEDFFESPMGKRFVRGFKRRR